MHLKNALRVDKKKKFSLFNSKMHHRRAWDVKRLVFETLEHRLALSSDPFISEFMAANNHTLIDGNGEYADWIEIHNPNSTAFDVSGWYLTDNPTKPTKWQFPTGTVLNAYEYKIIFCDDGFTTFPPGELHTTFKLDKEGEYLALVKSNGTTIVSEYGPDGSNFPPQSADVSYGVPMTATPTGVVTSSNFTSNAEGFAYSDDIIASVGSGSAINGAYSSTGGNTGGCLAITNSTMSSSITVNGGFSKSITISSDGYYNFSAQVKLALTSGSTYNMATTDSGTGYLIVKNSGGTTVLQKTFVQAGDGVSKSITSPWTTLNGNVGLTAGTYTVILALKDSTRVSGTGPKYISANFDNFSVASTLVTVDTTQQYFTIPTPREFNGAGLLGIVEDKVEFSQDHGFFTSPFDVALACDTIGATIRYTTDGSEPAFNTGTLYTGPIHITGTTVLRSTAFKTNYQPSIVETRTYIFLADVIHQPNGVAPGAGWPAQGTFNGQIMDYGMDDDPAWVAAWGSQLADALTAIPTMSLVTNNANLFDPTTGIYVNPTQSGSDWERPASLELIYPDGTTGFQINAGIRIRGSRSAEGDVPQHAFRVLFDQYGSPTLDYPLRQSRRGSI